MFALIPTTLARLAKIGRIGARILIGAMLAINLALLAPGVYFGLRLGHYIPIAVGIGMSVLLWAAAWGLLQLIRLYIRRSRTVVEH